MLAVTFHLRNWKQHIYSFTVGCELRAHIWVAHVYNFMNTASGLCKSKCLQKEKVILSGEVGNAEGL